MTWLVPACGIGGKSLTPTGVGTTPATEVCAVAGLCRQRNPEWGVKNRTRSYHFARPGFHAVSWNLFLNPVDLSNRKTKPAREWRTLPESTKPKSRPRLFVRFA